MGLRYRVHNHKAKLKKYTNNDTFGTMQKPVTPEDHNSMTSHFNVIKKIDQSTLKQGKIYDDKHNQRIKSPYKNKLENRKY